MQGRNLAKSIQTPNNSKNLSYIIRESFGLSEKTQKRGREEDEATSELERQRHAACSYKVLTPFQKLSLSTF